MTEIDALRLTLDPLAQTGVAAALVLITFGVALGLRLDQFAVIARAPKAFIAGMIGQLIGLPLATLGLIMLVQPAPPLALGMIIVACCPGGAASNMLSYFARANLALSMALTATTSLIAALATPVAILLWSSAYAPTAALLDDIGFDAVRFLLQTVIILGVPLATGLALAHVRPVFAARWRDRLARAGAVILMATVFYGSAHILPVLFAALPQFAPLVIAQNALAFAIGAALGRLSGADGPSRRTLTIEIGIQNSGLALVILLSQLQGLGGAAAVAASWGVWHLVAGGAIVALYRRLDAKEADATGGKTP